MEAINNNIEVKIATVEEREGILKLVEENA
jgi:hypothetical protein